MINSLSERKVMDILAYGLFKTQSDKCSKYRLDGI